MKSLTESLFDKDIVEKDIPVNCLKNFVYFDGQWVLRLKRGRTRMHTGQGGDIPLNIEGVKGDNALEVLDWNSIKKDYKKYHSNKVDLGFYAYASPSADNVRTVETTKKTEVFAKLIMSLPLIEDFNPSGFNSRVRDELIAYLNKYILQNYNDILYWDVIFSKYGIAINLNHHNDVLGRNLIRFEFLYL